jgi:hypothetical protein
MKQLVMENDGVVLEEVWLRGVFVGGAEFRMMSLIEKC